MKTIAIAVTALVMGASLALGAGALKSQPSSKGSSYVTPAEAPVQSEPPIQNQLARNANEIGEMRQRLERLERKGPDAPGENAAVRNTEPNSDPDMGQNDMLETSRKEAAVFQAKQQMAFDAEAADPSWSKKSTETLAQGLSTTISDRNFEVENVECRTTMCLAALKWKTYGDSLLTAGRLPSANFGLNCAQVVFTPTPADPSAPYEAKMYFDCTNLRAGS